MIKFIGDLSREDAEVLEHFGRRAASVLEFGVGGSTQILAQVSQSVLSLETEPSWIKLVESRLEKLKVVNCKIIKYDEWDKSGSCDLIFDDGTDDLRQEFAMASFPLLRENGWIIFHDTRRLKDVMNVLKLIEKHYLEVGDVSFNKWGSNMTVVRKKKSEPYVNWWHVEGQPAWKYGGAAVPDEFWEDK